MINGCLRPVYIELTQYWTCCCCCCCCGCSSCCCCCCSCCCCCCCCSSVASGHVKWTDIKMTKTQINSKQMAKKEEQKSIGRQRAREREVGKTGKKRIHRRFLLKRWMDLCFCLGLFYFVFFFFWFLVAGRIELGGFLLVCSTSRPSLDLFCCFPLLCFPFVPSLLRKGLSYAGCNWVTFLGSKKRVYWIRINEIKGGSRVDEYRHLQLGAHFCHFFFPSSNLLSYLNSACLWLSLFSLCYFAVLHLVYFLLKLCVYMCWISF